MVNRKNVLDLIETNENFSILLKILGKSGFGRALRHKEEPFTFFASTDGAFYQLFHPGADNPKGNQSKILITSILGRHLIPRIALYSDELQQRTSVTTSEGNTLTIRHNNHCIFLVDAQIVTPGTIATNGVILAIDKVLLTNR